MNGITVILLAALAAGGFLIYKSTKGEHTDKGKANPPVIPAVPDGRVPRTGQDYENIVDAVAGPRAGNVFKSLNNIMLGGGTKIQSLTTAQRESLKIELNNKTGNPAWSKLLGV